MLSNYIFEEYVWKTEKGNVASDSLSTGLPVIRIDTANKATIKSRENYYDAAINIASPESNSSEPLFLNIEQNITGTTQIRGRGNNTWYFPKRPYRLKFPERTNLFPNVFRQTNNKGSKSWVLLANYLDPTLLMNSTAFWLGREMNLPFTNNSIHVDLILNGVYEGTYELTEQVQVDKNRVNIDDGEDGDEAFFVEIDSYYDEDPKFRTGHYNLPVMIKSPEDLPDASGYGFVKECLDNLEAKMSADDFPDNGYRDLIDVDTVVKFILANEIIGNGDGIGSLKSVYMYKDKRTNDKISMGPLWDFDRSCDYSGSGNVYFKNSKYHISKAPFFQRFFDDPSFVASYKSVWNTLYASGALITDLEAFIDQKVLLLNGGSQQANFAVWKWNNKPNYANEISKLKNFLHERIIWLNSEINAME
jgi:hypothetical protein